MYCYEQGNELGIAIAFGKACCSYAGLDQIAIIYI